MFSRLKSRFTIFAVVLVVVVFAAELLALKNVSNTSDEIAGNLAKRYASQNYSQQIYDDLFDSYKNLNAFLLDPARTQLRGEIHASIQNSIEASRALSSTALLVLPNGSPIDLDELTALLIELNSDLSNVLSVRLVGSEEWRTDIALINEQIESKLDAITSIFAQLNAYFEVESVRDIDLLIAAAKLQSGFMLLSSICIVIFLGLTIFFFETLILRPVRLVSEAMKAVAFGESGVSLPSVGAKETQNLIDAFNEMRSQVRHRQFELEHQALHDSLTGLANRTLLRDRLAQAVYNAKQAQGEFSLLILDVDRFKEINESLGHQVGDMLLVEVGVRLESMLREIDTVARLGGDEFAILLPHAGTSYAQRIIDRIERMLKSIHTISGYQIYVSATIGVASFPEHGTNANVLLKHADAALNYAQNIQSTFSFYDEKSNGASPDRITLSGDLRDAISNNSLYLEYQPQFDFETAEVVGVEALIRWQHPHLGNIAADQVISIAEQTGQINAITNWVMNAAVKQCADWRSEGLKLGMSVNLSVLNLQDQGLTKEVASCLSRYDLSQHYLTFEITESAMMINPVSAMKTLRKLESMGLKLVIDDFGTGFSSLSYLKQLPVGKLKLDKSFVIALDKDSNDEVIVRSTIELAHNLGLQVVAEGVESRASWDILKSLNCDFAQGYYMSKPKSAADLKGWLNDRDALESLVG
ncbi:MAG: EAL domain-containing protein [Gammaproteobacteria bacterium]|nr:EAL domain-containing protein [Gammaproteobacteria bacterium]